MIAAVLSFVCFFNVVTAFSSYQTMQSNNKLASRSMHPKQIIKEMSICESSEKAIDVFLHNHPFLSEQDSKYDGPYDSKPILHLIGILTKNDDIIKSFDLLSKVLQSKVPNCYKIQTYKAIISSLGSKKEDERILRFIYHDIPFHTKLPPPIDIYHVAINALGKAKNMNLVMDMIADMKSKKFINIVVEDGSSLEYNFPSPDRMVYLTAMTASVRSKSSDISVRLLKDMSDQGIKPDRVAYNQVLASLAQCPSHQRYNQAMKIWEDMEADCESSNAAYKSLITLLTKEKKWSEVTIARQKMLHRNGPVEESPGFLMDLDKLQKINGNKKWYKIGYVVSETEQSSNLMFGIQNHRNPTDNGVSLVFHEANGKKVGFMLIRNQIDKDMLFSDIMGMYINDDQRGRGLAKICVAIWLQICLECGAFPRSERINKPLLSLILCNFGFEANEGGVEVEISPLAHVDFDSSSLGWTPHFALYSNAISPKDGTFGERELITQRMVIVNSPPSPRGKIAKVKTTFSHPLCRSAPKSLDDTIQNQSPKYDQCEKAKLQNLLSQALKGKLSFEIDANVLRRVIFGYLLSSENLQQSKKRDREDLSMDSIPNDKRQKCIGSNKNEMKIGHL